MTKKMVTDTIKGYFYQFDYSIKTLLDLKNDSDTAVIEGIEDIDKSESSSMKSAIQCKYYEKTEYNHSVIKNAIQHMLTHYSEVKSNESEKVNYLLYGHFKKGTEKLPEKIDIDFLKEKFLRYGKSGMVTYHHNEQKLSDKDLKDFLKLLKIDINAESYKSQLSSVHKLITREYDCEEYEAENFFYNNSLRVIKDLAVENDISNRTLSKGTFIKKVDTQKNHFNIWFARIKGKREYHKYLRRKYFTALKVSPFERFFLIEIGKDDEWQDIKDLIFTLSDKYSQLSEKKPNTFCPYLYLHNLKEERLIDLKKELHTEEFNFIDGYDFLGSEFSIRSITKSANHENQIKIKFINNLIQLNKALNDVDKTKEIYQFYKKATFFNTNNEAIKQVDMAIDSINEIKEIV